MPRRNPEETGTSRPFSRRYGYRQFPRPGGLNKSGTAGDIGPEEFRELENVRYKGQNRLISRGGQSPVTTVAMAGCVVGMIEIEGGLGVFVGSNTGDLRFDRWSQNNSPEYQEEALDEVTSALPGVCQAWGDPAIGRHCFIEAGDVSYLWSPGTPGDAGIYEVVHPPPGTPQAEWHNLAKAVFRFPLTEFSTGVVVDEVRGAATADEVVAPTLYVGGITDGNVYRWDGINLSLDTPAPIGTAGERLILCYYNGDVYAWTTDQLFKRNLGAWDVVFAMPGGVSDFEPSAAVQYGQMMYCAGRESVSGDGMILGFDSSTGAVVVAREPTAVGQTALVCTDLAVVGGLLYYSWLGDPDPNVYIGLFDGASFADTEHTFSGESTVTVNRIIARGSDLMALVQFTPSAGLEDHEVLLLISGGIPTVEFDYTAVDPGLPHDMITG